MTFLDRPGDAHGRNYWINRLNTGTSRIDVFAGFVNSAEFTALARAAGLRTDRFVPAADAHAREFVRRLFRLTLQRDPDVTGINYWTNHLSNRTRTATQVGHGFIFSVEMNARGLNNTQFVNIMYDAFMGRPADVAGRNYWLGRMNAGMTRQQVFNGFASSPEFAGIAANYGIPR